MTRVRIGQGYDVHALVAGDGVRLGGVLVPCDMALLAHSDGDVLIHALCDAILGALGRGDIGQHFPDSSAANRDRDSREFLREVGQLMLADAYRLGNADITVIAEAPRIAAHGERMKALLAEDLDCAVDCINIKATTSEKLGYLGRGEGIAAQAVVLLEAIPV